MTNKKTNGLADSSTASPATKKELVYRCTRCGKRYDNQRTNSFRIESPLYAENDHYPALCKACVFDIYKKYKFKYNDAKKAFYLLCMKLDIYYNEKAYFSQDPKAISLIPGYLTLMGQPPYAGLCFDDTLNDGIEPSMVSKGTEANVTVKSLKTYSAEWMGQYTESELEYLNNYYKGLNEDYKIITQNHKDYARKIAQASLYMNQCYQELLGGSQNMDAYVKARDTFDTLCKSAKFSEQTRGINDVSLGGYGVTAERVEKEEWIPKHTPIEKDDVDKLIEYFSTIRESI